MPSTKTPPRLTADTIRAWRTVEDAPTLKPLALQRRTLREQRQLLMTRERERLTVLAQAYQEQQKRLARMDNADIGAYPPFDASRVQDATVLECREKLFQVSTELLQMDDAFMEQSEPVIGEYSALQKSLMVQLMDTALEALDTLEQVGIEGEHLCMQSWGCTGSYISNIGLFQRMQRRDRAVLQQERDRLAREVEVFYA